MSSEWSLICFWRGIKDHNRIFFKAETFPESHPTIILVIVEMTELEKGLVGKGSLSQRPTSNKCLISPCDDFNRWTRYESGSTREEINRGLKGWKSYFVTKMHSWPNLVPCLLAHESIQSQQPLRGTFPTVSPPVFRVKVSKVMWLHIQHDKELKESAVSKMLCTSPCVCSCNLTMDVVHVGQSPNKSPITSPSLAMKMIPLNISCWIPSIVHVVNK